MSEEQNQSVRYSQIMNNLSDDSFETSSIQFLLTRKNEMNWNKKKKMLFALVTLVVFVLIVSIVAMMSSNKNSMKSELNQENLKIQNLNSFTTTISFSNLLIFHYHFIYSFIYFFVHSHSFIIHIILIVLHNYVKYIKQH